MEATAPQPGAATDREGRSRAIHSGDADLGDRDPAGDGAPVVTLAFDEGEDHAEQAGGGECDAEQVEPVLAPGSEVRNQEESEGEREHAERDVHVKDRAPAIVLDEI